MGRRWLLYQPPYIVVRKALILSPCNQPTALSYCRVTENQSHAAMMTIFSTLTPVKLQSEDEKKSTKGHDGPGKKGATINKLLSAPLTGCSHQEKHARIDGCPKLLPLFGRETAKYPTLLAYGGTVR